MCEFRRLHTEDLDMVMRMNETFRSGFADRVAAGRFLKNERNWLYAAVCGLNVVGFAYGGVLHRLDGKEDMLYIHEVGVAGPQQRRGIPGAGLCGAAGAPGPKACPRREGNADFFGRKATTKGCRTPHANPRPKRGRKETL